MRAGRLQDQGLKPVVVNELIGAPCLAWGADKALRDELPTY